DLIHCSSNNNTELFKATIGGLGLTGLILSAEIALKKIPSEYLYLEYLKFNSLDDFFEINTSSEKHYEYTVAWVDVTNSGENTVRGIYQRANHIDAQLEKRFSRATIGIPFVLPFSLINKFSTSVFNYVYYAKQFNRIESKIVHYDAFFYPLDAIGNWNYLYGRKGFLQYQFVIPRADAQRTLQSIFNEFKKANLGSFLTVLKTFGDFEPAGYLSFPRAGVTVAIDFPITQSLFNVLDRADEIVVGSGGALYPAKDARMKPFVFKKSFGNLETFLKFKDPKFNSVFWGRVF
ncbi:MAG: FAD-binding protein, partial [Candidatus Kapaibacteriota bacterium]